LYVAFGGKKGLDAIALDVVLRSKRDPRISKYFEKTNAQGLADALAEQFCFLLGGPCVYSGATMAKAHKDMGIRTADLLALVETLQDAMDEAKIPYATQNKLVALLAPMNRDVVEKR
jgi:hemoglobin